MTYERGVSKGRPDISVLVELTVLSELWKKETHVSPDRDVGHLNICGMLTDE